MRYTVTLMLILSSCTFVPHNGNDVYYDKANISKDEAVHSKNSLEWWYFTGHLMDVNSGKEYGIEYVFFHFNPRNKRDYVMVNFAVTDPLQNKFYYDYKIISLKELLKPDLPLDFSFTNRKGSYELSGMTGNYVLKANMKRENIGVNLKTTTTKPVALHNGSGYETYGKYATAGYYSYTRLMTTGILMLDGNEIEVSGELWYDRQWNCIGVWQKEVAWDWISVQLDDAKSELMVYRLYHVGEEQIIYGGSFLNKDGELTELGQSDIQIEEIAHWKSKDSKIEYPTKWRVKIEKVDLDLEINASVDHQELKLKFTPIHKMYYWEGMCSARGTLGDKEVTGDSYIEMTNRSVVKKKPIKN